MFRQHADDQTSASTDCDKLQAVLALRVPSLDAPVGRLGDAFLVKGYHRSPKKRFLTVWLLRLPEAATQRELRELLPDQDIDIYFSQHTPPSDGLYPIRGVVMFGLAEMERAGLFADAMKTGHMETIGRMMNVSHDGDRVISTNRDGSEIDYRAPVSDDYFSGLIRDLESRDPERINRAQLQWQPGSYRCSLREIDQMVDISLQTKGVFGAQLAGAGLGGCMMVLSSREAVHDLKVNLTEQYYDRYKKKPSILICRPVAGSGVLLLN